MAFISAADAKVIRNELKAEFPQFKFSVSIHNYTALNVVILEGPLQFVAKPYSGINHYHLGEYNHSDILARMVAIINKKNWDRSDSQVDHFDVGFYLSMSQGRWDKPYILKDARVEGVIPKRTHRARKTKSIYTKEFIVGLLEKNDLAVERALIVLYDNQTDEEQSGEYTVSDNHRGFSGFHAKIGTSMAKQVLAGRHLTDRQLAVWRKKDTRGNMRIARYWKQLVEAADRKSTQPEIVDN